MHNFHQLWQRRIISFVDLSYVVECLVHHFFPHC